MSMNCFYGGLRIKRKIPLHYVKTQCLLIYAKLRDKKTPSAFLIIIKIQ